MINFFRSTVLPARAATVMTALSVKCILF